MSGPRPATYYDSGQKLCQRCGEIKTRAQFGKNGPVSYQSHCKPCRREYRVELRRRFPEKAHERDRRNNLMRKYGLTPTEWQALFEKQGRACAICRATETRGSNWHTDHCHRSNVVRGILCHDCNMAVAAYENVVLPNREAFDAFLSQTWSD